MATLKGVPTLGANSNDEWPTPDAWTPASSANPFMLQLTPDDRQKFLRLFFQSSPFNELLNGDKARDIFLKSKLSTEKLGQIWKLADTCERGSLDATDFVIGMFLIQSVMSGTLHVIPSSLPAGLYEQASGGLPHPSLGSPLQAQFTGTSSSQPAATPIRKQSTSQTFAVSQPFNYPKWDVTHEEKAKSDSFFATLDPQGHGFIEGDVAVTFMVQSQLSESVLEQVWDLADLNKDGKLTCDGFAVTMHLINKQLAGRELPTVLPPSLVPPSFRAHKVRQSTDLIKMREELIRAKSEASAVQFELDEAREDVLRDKEELQDVQRRAQKIADEVGRTKTEVEKVKREAKQVKSLLAIARKLLASAEREKVKAHTEIDEARTEVRMAQKELEDMVRQVTQGQHTSTTEIISSASAVASTLNAGFSSPSRTDTFSPTQVELPVPFSNTPPMRSDSINPFGWLQNTSVWAASQASPFTNVSSTIVGTSTGGSAASFEMAASTWKPGNSSKRFSTSTATENNVPTATQFSPPSQQNNSGSAPDW